jgi:hypothetical protein
MRTLIHIVVVLVSVVFSSAARSLANEPDFVPLFDGTTFGGWIGGPSRFVIHDGMLISKKGCSGNMLSEKEYADFTLRFEFRLTPGANNGVGIRVPRDGEGSYDGIELQILDDSAEKYKQLEPFQYHGSAYGIAAARRGALRPIGDWNEEEIRCRNRQIKVVLNGATILNIDLDVVVPHGKTIDGSRHPGLLNARGHIALLCHGDEVAFRTIRIRETEKDEVVEPHHPSVN